MKNDNSYWRYRNDQMQFQAPFKGDMESLLGSCSVLRRTVDVNNPRSQCHLAIWVKNPAKKPSGNERPPTRLPLDLHQDDVLFGREGKLVDTSSLLV